MAALSSDTNPSLPNDEPHRHICLFGLSANPPTGRAGHRGVRPEPISRHEAHRQNQSSRHSHRDHFRFSFPFPFRCYFGVCLNGKLQ